MLLCVESINLFLWACIGCCISALIVDSLAVILHFTVSIVPTAFHSVSPHTFISTAFPFCIATYLHFHSFPILYRHIPHSYLFSFPFCTAHPTSLACLQGTEKVILIQEQLQKNRIIIDTDTAGNVVAAVTSSTHERKSKTTIVHKQGRMYLKHNAFVYVVHVVLITLGRL